MEHAVHVISAEEWELTSFFEAVPNYPNEGEPWPYCTVEFDSERDGARIHCTLQPAYRDVDLKIWVSENLVYKLHALAVRDIQYGNEDGKEQILIWLSDTETVEIQWRPTPAVMHQSSRE